MNKLYLLLLSTLISASLFAQANGKHMGSTGVGGDLSIQNNDGKMIPIGAKDDTQGNPLFLENWVGGTVLLKNGMKFTDTALNYSLFEDKLYFKRKEQFFIVDGNISEFYLVSTQNEENGITYHFASGYPATSNTNENTFFQLLADGKQYQLIKWQHKKIRESYSYGGKSESEYVTQEAYFVYEKLNRKMIGIGNKANALNIKSTLSIEESIWKAYLNNHTANPKSEISMVAFISYLNSL